jgi:hypothetical protein
LIVMKGGNAAAPSLLAIVTETPPLGAGPLSITVASLAMPATTLDGATATCASIALGPVGVPQPPATSARTPKTTTPILEEVPIID